MNQKTYFALFVLDEAGVALFGGAFPDRETAEAKGRATGKRFEIKPTVLEG